MDSLKLTIAVSDVLLNVYGANEKRIAGLKKAGFSSAEREEIQQEVNRAISDDKESWYMAVACIADHYGKNPERAKRLGRWAEEVQKRINAIYDMRGKSIERAAKDVINGNYGNGTVRELLLSFCGYTPGVVQDKVNQLKNPAPTVTGTKFRVHAIHFFKENEAAYGSCVAIYQYAADGSIAKCILIDTAMAKTANVVIKTLKAMGVTKIDAIFITHGHGDHYGALSKILKAFSAGWLYLPDCTELDRYQKGYGNALRRQAKKIKNVRWFKQGESAQIGEIKVKNLFICPANKLSEHDSHHFVNNESMQLSFTLGRVIYNNGGDMSNPANRVMDAAGVKYSAHISHLKWHTDGNATNEVWLEGITDGIEMTDQDGDVVKGLFDSDYHHDERSGRGGVRKKCEKYKGVVYRNAEDGEIYHDIQGDKIITTTTKSKKRHVYTIAS